MFGATGPPCDGVFNCLLLTNIWKVVTSLVISQEAKRRFAASERLRDTLIAPRVLTRFGEAGADVFTNKQMPAAVEAEKEKSLQFFATV